MIQDKLKFPSASNRRNARTKNNEIVDILTVWLSVLEITQK
jgi:hypothetical protein